MDLRSDPPTPAKPTPATGELIVQVGRQAGTRRPLNAPLTFIGRAPGCDLRLNVEGVSPLHCLIVQSPTGFLVRDLDSAGGTFVNGKRVANQAVGDGDTLAVGPFLFRLHLPTDTAAPQETNAAEKDALRVQAAAV